MSDKNLNDAPQEFVADLLARQVPAMQQQIMSLQIEVAYRDKVIAELRGKEESDAKHE